MTVLREYFFVRNCQLVGEVYCRSLGDGGLVSSKRIRFMMVDLKPDSFTLLSIVHCRGRILCPHSNELLTHGEVQICWYMRKHLSMKQN
jgi:hypothetical protein